MFADTLIHCEVLFTTVHVYACCLIVRSIGIDLELDRCHTIFDTDTCQDLA